MDLLPWRSKWAREGVVTRVQRQRVRAKRVPDKFLSSDQVLSDLAGREPGDKRPDLLLYVLMYY